MYGAGYLVWYGSTPLGEHPALDGAQNLELSRQLWTGQYNSGVFHRSPWYSFMLVPLWTIQQTLGITVPNGVRFLNFVALILTAFFTGKAATLLWKNKNSGLLTACLILGNPVILFFAGDPLDTLWASASMAAFLFILTRDLARKRMTVLSSFSAALILGFGAAVRPVGIVLSTLWPLIVLAVLIAQFRFSTPVRTLTLIISSLIGTLAFPLATGFLNLHYSGKFTTRPEGSAFILWWANSAHANGLYYYQQHVAGNLSHGQNPATYEAEMHYLALNGKNPESILEMNRFFMHEAVNRAIQNPAAVARLLAIKAYATVHNFEQYDNKSYFLHKDLSPWIRWNPLGWGVILTVAALGFLTLFRINAKVPALALVIFLLYASIIIATYPSNRFRVPLLPLLTIFSGCVPVLFSRGKLPRHISNPKLVISMGIVVFTIFYPFNFITPKDTVPADYCILARASHLAGNDTEATSWARKALEHYPSREDMLRIFHLSRFLSWFTGQSDPPCIEEAWNQIIEMEDLPASGPDIEFMKAAYQWNLGLKAEALETWKTLSEATHHAPSARILNSLDSYQDTSAIDAAWYLSGFHPCSSSSE